MEVLGKETPRSDNQIPLHALVRQPVWKILPVSINAEYVGPLDAPPHHMMQRPGTIQSRLSRHTKKVDLSPPFAKLF